MPTVWWNCWANILSRISGSERRDTATLGLSASQACLTRLQTPNQFLGGQDLGEHRGLGNQGGAV